MEEWRDVVGYSGRYQVSSRGNVRTGRQGDYKAKSVQVYGKKLVVYLSEKKSSKRVTVSSLVSEAFPELGTSSFPIRDMVTEIILKLKSIGPVINFNDVEQVLCVYTHVNAVLAVVGGRKVA